MKYLPAILIIFPFFCLSQNEITEVKNTAGHTTVYFLQSDKVMGKYLQGQFRIKFIYSTTDEALLMEITIPEGRYRRITTKDSIQIHFNDNSSVILPVIEENKGYMLKENWEWVAYQFYLPFKTDCPKNLLQKLATTPITGLTFILKPVNTDLSADYNNIFYSVSKRDKRKFQQKANEARIMQRNNITEKGQQHVMDIANQFILFLDTQKIIK